MKQQGMLTCYVGTLSTSKAIYASFSMQKTLNSRLHLVVNMMPNVCLALFSLFLLYTVSIKSLDMLSNLSEWEGAYA